MYRSFDNSDGTVEIPGKNVEETLEMLRYMVETLSKRESLTRSKLYRSYRVYDDSVYFVSSHNDYLDRVGSLEMLKEAFVTYCRVVQAVDSTYKPSRTDSHNINLAHEIIQQLQKWLERVQYE